MDRLSKGKGELLESLADQQAEDDLNSEERRFISEAAEVERSNVVVSMIPAAQVADVGMVEVVPEPEPVVPAKASATLLHCPFRGCQHKTANPESFRSHLTRCLQATTMKLKIEHPEWNDSSVRKELEQLVDPLYLEKFGRRWCPMPDCFTMLKRNVKRHKKCGWGHGDRAKKGRDVELQLRGASAGESFRPSDLIEQREPMAQSQSENRPQNLPTMALSDVVALISDIGWPSIGEVALLPKFVHNPNNVALRPAVGLLWTQALSFTLKVIVEAKELVGAWTLWFMLAPCTLSILAGGKDKEWDVQVCSKLLRWMNGDFLALWSEAEEHSSARIAAGCDRIPSEDTRAASVQRAKRLIRYGRYSDAAKALMVEEPVQLTPDVLTTLRAKFPEGDVLLLNDVEGPFRGKRITASADTVRSKVQSFPRGSSAGLSGMWPELVSTAERYSQPLGVPILEPLAKVIEILANGEAPQEVAPWIIGGRLVPVGAKVRPIVVSDFLGRLSSKVALSEESHLFPALFHGLQGGVGESCASDRTIHLLREDLEKHSHTLDWCVLVVDFRNGFNEANRHTVLDELRRKCPDLVSWFSWSYGRPIQLVLANGDHLEGSKGVGQGDPASPFFFSLNLQPVLEHIEQTWKPQGLGILRAFLDDGVFSGPIPVVLEILEFLQSDEVISRGLHIQPSKCFMYIPSAGASQTVKHDYAIPSELQVSGDGVVVLGVPVGSALFVEQFLSEFFVKVQAFHDRVAGLETPQLMHTLSRLCSGATKVGHLIRCVPPDSIGSFCADVDASMDRQVLKILGLENRDSLSEVQWAQVHLPLSMSGLGLPLSSKIKEAAFLASSLSVSRQPELLQGNCTVIQSVLVQSALNTYNTLVATSDRFDFASLSQQELVRVSQRELTAKIHRRDFDIMLKDPSLGQRDWARIKEQTRSGSSAWMTPLFVRAQLVIPEKHFSLLLRRHLGHHFFADNIVTTCSRSVLPPAAERRPCKEQQDPRLIHATDLCKANHWHRHNTVAEAVKKMCKAAGIDHMSEVACIPGSNDVPADIYIHQGPSDTPVAVDMSVVTPLAMGRMGTFATKAGTCTATREAEKFAKYREHFDKLDGSIRFMPFVISTFGGVGEKGTILMAFIAQKLAQRWVVSIELASQLLRTRVLAAMMKFVAMNLSHALCSHHAQHQMPN